MNKNEAAALIRQKIKDAEKNYEVALANRSFDDCSWYNGIQRGLQDALSLLIYSTVLLESPLTS